MNPILARFQDQPSLIAPSGQAWFESCVQEAAKVAENGGLDPASILAGEDFWFVADDPRARFRPYKVSAGILSIPVKGALLNGFPFAFGSYATGYEYVAAAMARGLADAQVNGIALVIDSPGGMVAGNFDLVDRIFAARGVKPIRAYAAESAFSAAYSIASAADDITVSRTGGVGSIGVVTVHADHSQALDAAGIKVTFIHAGARKVDGNACEPLPEAVKARIQERIDATYDVFVSTVARNRNMEERAVRATEAATFMASEAISNGLADRIGTLEDSLAAFAASFTTDQERDETMTDTVDLDAVRAAANEEGVRAGMIEGAAAERARVNTILGSDAAKARPKAAMSVALRTGMDADSAEAFLADLPEETAEAAPAAAPVGAGAPKGMFEAAMAGSRNPDLGAGDEIEADAMSVADRIMASAGKKRRA